MKDAVPPQIGANPLGTATAMIGASAAIYGMRMLALGARAPEFTLPDQDDRNVSLSNLLNRGALILYFYPADFTPGCTKEACMLRDLHAEILKVGLRVAGVSPQSPQSHREFRERYKLPYTLLSDTEKFVIKMYDLNGPLGFGVRRGTYLIDQTRQIRATVMADFRISQHEAFIRKATALSATSRIQ
jgi:thioredoxin-dependent peroxiredoxin